MQYGNSSASLEMMLEQFQESSLEAARQMATPKRVWLYTQSPSGSQRTLQRQKKQLTAYAEQQGHIVIGVSEDTRPKDADVYYSDNIVPDEILIAAAAGKIDVVLLTSISQLIPKHLTYTWRGACNFYEKLRVYDVQIQDLVMPGKPFEATSHQLLNSQI